VSASFTFLDSRKVSGGAAGLFSAALFFEPLDELGELRKRHLSACSSISDTVKILQQMGQDTSSASMLSPLALFRFAPDDIENGKSAEICAHQHTRMKPQARFYAPTK